MENVQGIENKSDKKINKLRIVNIAVSSVLLCVSVVTFIVILSKSDPDNRLLSCIGAVILTMAPIFAETLLKDKIPTSIIFIFVVFIFFALLLGNVYRFYARLKYYDRAVHGFFGYIACLVFYIILLSKLENRVSLRPFTVVFFCFSVSLMCGALWEVMEFSADKYLGQSAQGGMNDTMGDIISNLIGAIIFAVHYIIYKVSKKNLILGSVIEKDR